MKTTPRRVVLAAFDGIELLDLVGPAEVFAGASLARGDRPAYELVVATLDGGPMRASSGLRLAADAALPEVDGRLDTLLVAGGFGYREAMADRRLVEHVARLAGQARRVASVCTGTFVLARAGLLEGRRATTHWAAAAELAREFPGARVEPDRIFVRDGPVWTSAGCTAGLDLGLALVEEDLGAPLAHKVARWMVLFIHRAGGQSQFSERLAHPVSATSPLRGLLDEIVADPAGDHRICALAGRAALSERHLTRLFAEHLSTTPARYVERVRVEAAREQLERGVAVAHAAQLAGFGSAETMRRSFLRTLGVGPREYLSRFGPRGASVGLAA